VPAGTNFRPLGLTAANFPVPPFEVPALQARNFVQELKPENGTRAEGENTMAIAKIISVGAAAVVITSFSAIAQQPRLGLITEVNRLNNTIAIRTIQAGTVGANNTGPSESFKVPSNISLETVHAGDRVSYSANDSDGTKTITKIDRQ
jgi:Copper binding periplasmic protein CusF